METIFEAIQQATLSELQEIMAEIEERYAILYPDWDVTYLAIHKDPVLRKAELANIIHAVGEGLAPPAPLRD